MRILGIETTCDETAASVVECADTAQLHVVSSIVSSQVALHAPWGGVVPNLAAREHTKNLVPVIHTALSNAGCAAHTLDAIAVANRPGLIPALLAGTAAAKSLAYAWHLPLIAVHHIEGHIYANWIDHAAEIAFPIVALVVSGGHTQLIVMRRHCDYTIIGQTRDDAVGESFDKVARLLGLGYPGGPAIMKRADSDAPEDAPVVHLPRPMAELSHYDFSFSGLKTAVLYAIKKFRAAQHLSENAPLPEAFGTAVAREFQAAVIDVLTAKTLHAARAHHAATIILAGGVSANTALRDALFHAAATHLPRVRCVCPSLPYCGDNAAMIAVAAYYRLTHSPDRAAYVDGWRTVTAVARDSIEKASLS